MNKMKELMKKQIQDSLSIQRKSNEEIYKEEQENPNAMSKWLPYFIDKGFNIPKTIIHEFPEEWFSWLNSDNYSEEKIKEFNAYMKKLVLESREDFISNALNNGKPLFMKTGSFSDKFRFSGCKVLSTEALGEQFLNIFYSAMMVSCPPTTEVVIREFIDTKSDRKYIYDGMKLNTEYRIFYDFDKKQIVGVFNYWDRKVLSEALENPYSMDDYHTFVSEIDNIEKEYEEQRDSLIAQCNQILPNVQLKGIWSIDFMFDGDKFWLIDAALGRNSYYFNRIKAEN